jgi:VWFA-related protein
MRLIWAFCLTSVAVHVSAQDPARPVFRSGIDLVTVDVAVLTKEGKPITGLVASDFTITAGERRRRVVSADFMASKTPDRAATRGGTVVEGAPTGTTNAQPAGGRAFLFVVDVENIRAGEGRGAVEAVSGYLERLDPRDRVGFISLPYGTPRVDLTTSRAGVRQALARVAGLSNRDRDLQMSMGEATYIARGDRQVLADYLKKSSVTSEEVRQHQRMAERILDQHRLSTRTLLDSLRALAEAMAPIDGPKAIILISEGLKTDDGTLAYLRTFAAAAERARVTVYSLHLEIPLSEAAYRDVSASRRILDNDIGFDGMVDVSVAARGAAFRISADAEQALRQIDTEMSAYYILSFQRDASDRDGVRTAIDIRVSRPDVVVRARTEFTPRVPVASRAPGTGPRDLRSAIGELLRWPVPIGEIGVEVATYGLPVPDTPSDVRTVVAAAFAAGRRPLAALGWEVTDERGKVVADAFEPNLATVPLSADRVLYAGAVLVAPGRYQLKLAAIDADGRRGSVEHAFDAKAWEPGPIRISDVLLGESSAGAFRPSPRLAPGSRELTARIEIRGDAPELLVGVTARLQVVRAGETDVLAEVPLIVEETVDPLKRSAECLLRIDRLPAGDYVVRVLATTRALTLQRARAFRKS